MQDEKQEPLTYILYVPMGWGAVIKKQDNILLKTSGLASCIGFTIETEKYIGMFHIIYPLTGKTSYGIEKYIEEIAKRFIDELLDFHQSSYIKTNVLSNLYYPEVGSMVNKNLQNIFEKQIIQFNNNKDKIINRLYTRNIEYSLQRYKMVLTPTGELYISASKDISISYSYPDEYITRRQKRYPDFLECVTESQYKTSSVREEVNLSSPKNFLQKIQKAVLFLDDTQKDKLLIPVTKLEKSSFIENITFVKFMREHIKTHEKNVPFTERHMEEKYSEYLMILENEEKHLKETPVSYSNYIKRLTEKTPDAAVLEDQEKLAINNLTMEESLFYSNMKASVSNDGQTGITGFIGYLVTYSKEKIIKCLARK